MFLIFQNCTTNLSYLRTYLNTPFRPGGPYSLSPWHSANRTPRKAPHHKEPILRCLGIPFSPSSPPVQKRQNIRLDGKWSRGRPPPPWAVHIKLRDPPFICPRTGTNHCSVSFYFLLVNSLATPRVYAVIVLHCWLSLMFIYGLLLVLLPYGCAVVLCMYWLFYIAQIFMLSLLYY